MAQDIEAARAQHPDALIACMHWGDEYQSLPNKEQKNLTNWLLQQGVTHIIGSHPHVVQPHGATYGQYNRKSACSSLFSRKFHL